MSDASNPQGEKLIEAYNRMMGRVKAAFEEAERKAVPTLQHNIDKAIDTAEKLGELTRDEAEKVGYYLKRDLQDAGAHLAETGNDLTDWLQFDIKQIEDRLLELFAAAADRTRLEWLEFQSRGHTAPDATDETSDDIFAPTPFTYHTGEITGPGTLQCNGCGHTLHFHATGHIPPCPTCRNTNFQRVTEDEMQ
jgi:hypothetical protein